MQIKKVNNDFLQFKFRLYNEEFENYLCYAFEKVKDKIEIKGFRKGFVTRSIFKKKIGDQKLYKDALEILIKKKSEEIIKNKKKFMVMGQPKLVSCNIEDLKKKDFFDFALEFFLKPEVILCNYKDIKVTFFDNISIREKEIQIKINDIIKQNTFKNFKPQYLSLEKNDLAIFDLSIFLDEKKSIKHSEISDFSLEIGNNQFIMGFDDGVIGMKVKENRIFSLIIPDNFYDQSIASKKIFFEVFLKSIKIKEEFNLNDEFIKSLKIPRIFTISDLKKEIKKKLELDQQNKIRQKQEKEILDFLVKNSFLKINENLIIYEIEDLKKNFNQELNKNNLNIEKYLNIYKINMEEFEQRIRKQAIRNIKIDLILEEIIEKENIKVLPTELDYYSQEMSFSYNISVDQIKKNFFLMEDIKKNILKSKIIDFLIKNSIEKNKENIQLEKI
ncbi:trigger factor [Candidatus Phytoplasma oryzae]|uniref:Trigger factor n=1 Tax=Candidatus Phytoplasma oryzae TaxID=203274 RepID=A0A139JR69_9MOLU|nr:trigger factor [Candidatus Phytoplasma oryzae]KXT29334.1 trigger factor [Candidatus Phytoplasma oryzae]RAM57888.1 hypothetical protein DH96_01045 [Candidatus Phytoplasma oryzae]